MSEHLEIIRRIQEIYNSCSEEEQEYLYQILKEFAETGESKTYEEVWLSDYKEIPVTIGEFITSDTFLGKATRNGQGIFPTWKTCMSEIFAAGNKYDEVVFTGATRIGKTSTAITCLAYMLYRLMCLRDPQKFFGLKEVSKFSILFFNITKDLAKGVAFQEFQTTLQVSPWFNAHGSWTQSDRNPTYIPEGNKISIDIGSSAQHALGMQVFCLVGNTKICTPDGAMTLEELNHHFVRVYQVDSHSNDYLNVPIFPGLGYVIQTKYTDTTTRITLVDGTLVEGTSDHKIMMSTGQYCELGNIEIGNHLRCFVDSVSSDIEVLNTQTIFHEVPLPVYDVWNVEPYHNFIVQGNTCRLQISNCAIMDEVNFARSGIKDINKAKTYMMDTYNTISARIKGTFRKNGEVYGKLFVVSSKKGDQDFLENYIQMQQSSGAGDHMYIVDKPQWEVLPPERFSSGRFFIAVGDRSRKGFVIPDNQSGEDSLAELKSQGYKILSPPLDMKTNFVADFEIALRDLAGISVPGSLSFITQASLDSVIDNSRRNPFINDILQIGTKDTFSIEEFFHIEHVDSDALRSPMYIHLDLSLTTDRTGISGCSVVSRKDIEMEDGRKVSMPFFKHVFSIALEAPKGDKIPYSKIVAFICWLRQQKFDIRLISRDQFQSEYLAQILEEQGFKVSKISLDRTPDGYMALRSVILEERINMLHCQLLEDELIELQRDSVTGKIDHKVGGCFTGDTKIRLVDGRALTIEELIMEQNYKTNYVYTVNEHTLDIEPKRIERVFQTKWVTNILEIELDTGELIHCTEDHRLMLRDGTYIEARYLESGTSLMPLYTRVDTDGYRLYYNPATNSWEYEHRKFAIGDIAKGFVVHHKNLNPLDNRPCNLQCISISEHRKIHNKYLNYDKVSSSLKRWHRSAKGTEYYRNRSQKISRKVSRHYLLDPKYQIRRLQHEIRICKVEDYFGVQWDTLTTKEKSRLINKYDYATDPNRRTSLSKSLSENHKLGKYKNAKIALSNRVWYTDGKNNVYIKSEDIPPEGFYRGRTLSVSDKLAMKQGQKNRSEDIISKLRINQCKYSSNCRWYTNGTQDKFIHIDSTIPEGFYPGRCKIKRKNHKVKSIRILHKPCRVYDLTIEDNPNFALDCGIFVHNSKDLADSFAGSIWNAILDNPEPTPSINKYMKSISAVNTSKSAQSAINSLFPTIKKY